MSNSHMQVDILQHCCTCRFRAEQRPGGPAKQAWCGVLCGWDLARTVHPKPQCLVSLQFTEISVLHAAAISELATVACCFLLNPYVPIARAGAS
jgi:hypothetical protein